MKKRLGLRQQPRKSHPPARAKRWLVTGLQMLILTGVVLAICWWLIASLAFPVLFQLFTTSGQVVVLAGVIDTSPDARQVKVAVITDSEQSSRVYQVELAELASSQLAQTRSDDRHRRAALSHLLGLSVTQLVTLPAPSVVDLLAQGHWQELKYQYLLWKLTDRDGAPQLSTQELVQRISPFSLIGSQCAIGVTNTSDVAGAAGRLATFLERQGAAVVRVTSRDAQVAHVTILLDQEYQAACQPVVPLLSAAFAEDTEILMQPDVLSNYRANMVVLLSETVAQQLVDYYSSE